MQLPDKLVEQFNSCLETAKSKGELEPTAMTLATLGLDGGVSARMVLLKEFDASGFVFYTNLESIKGQQLAADPAAALVCFFRTTQTQVRVEGVVSPVSDEQADAYFSTRDRGSQLGAWASQQSRPLSSRAHLLKEVIKVESRFMGRAITRPPNWSGFRLAPTMIEFWEGKASRLHDRVRYTLQAGTWNSQRLYP